MKCVRVPKYKAAGIVLLALVLYFMMMSPVFIVYVAKRFPDFAQKNNLFNDTIIELDSIEKNLCKNYDSTLVEINNAQNDLDSISKLPDSCISEQVEYFIDSIHQNIENNKTIIEHKFDHNSDNYFENPFSLYFKFALISWLIIYLINFPVKLFFSRKRRNRKPGIKVEKFTKKIIHRTPLINSLILLLSFVFMHILMSKNLLQFNELNISLDEKEIYKDYILISSISSFLVVVFIFVWQRFRVSSKYIEIIYTKDELKKRLPCLPEEKISRKMLLTSLMTTFLPLLVVCFYVFTSISKVKELSINVVTPEINKIFLGDFSKIINIGQRINELVYINSIDTILMIFAIINGTAVTLIYIAFFVKLSTKSIVKPIEELVSNMKSVDKKGITKSNIVRSNDEIGILAEEFNNMSDKINNYIGEISKMNEELEQKVIDRTAEIMHQKEEIETQRDEIEAQRDEIEKQRDYVIEQHDKISIQNKHITDSIEYAKRIQNAVLIPSEDISKILEEHLIFYRPRNIVSGDFYLVEETEEVKIIIVADCTGHGVPGAFMSMLGIALLKEILHKKECNSPSYALNELRNQIKTFLRQTGKDNENKDGMDISMCVIDKKSNVLDFAGANNPAILIRKEQSNFEIIDLKPNKMPIGIYIGDEKPFETKTIQLQKDDTIYMFSDGYLDQFGGETGRKFLMKNFKELLLSIQNQNLTNQKKLIIEAFENWKGELHEQVDDVLVLGYKI